jgi:hypothetical protein
MHAACVCVCATGYVAPGDKFKDQPTIELQVVSELVSWLYTSFAHTPDTVSLRYLFDHL